MATPDEGRPQNPNEGGKVIPDPRGVGSGQPQPPESSDTARETSKVPAPVPVPESVPRSPDAPAPAASIASEPSKSAEPQADTPTDEPITHDEGRDTPTPVSTESQPEEYQNDPYHDSHHGDPHYDEYHSTHAGHDDHHKDPYHQQSEDYYHDEYHHSHDDPTAGGASGGGGGAGTYAGGGGRMEDLPPDADELNEEEGGGPIKGFLEHLEDLRWVLIKCVAAAVISMVICLVGANFIIGVLKQPLEQAKKLGLSESPITFVVFGTNIWELNWTTNSSFGSMDLGTNKHRAFAVEPVQVGTNYFLRLAPTPVPESKKHLVDITVLDPGEVFTVLLDIILYGGLGMASPFIFFFIGEFVVPALRKKERLWLKQGVSIGAGLFILGVLFCYFIMLPVTFLGVKIFAEWMGFTVENWRAAGYISFMMKFMLGMGLSFELPIVILTLVRIGLLDYKKLANFRSYMVVILLVVSAFITPTGDPFTMVLMAAPLWLLYEMCILVAWIWHRREQKAMAAKEAAEKNESR